MPVSMVTFHLLCPSEEVPLPRSLEMCDEIEGQLDNPRHPACQDPGYALHVYVTSISWVEALLTPVMVCGGEESEK